MVNHNQGMFCDYRHCGSEDTMVLIGYMILQDHIIKGPCNQLIKISKHPAKFGLHGRCGSGDMF